MNAMIMFVSLMQVVQPSNRPGHEIKVVSLAMQTAKTIETASSRIKV